MGSCDSPECFIVGLFFFLLFCLVGWLVSLVCFFFVCVCSFNNSCKMLLLLHWQEKKREGLMKL